MSREDTRSTTEADAGQAEFRRAQRAGEDSDSPDEFASRSTWDPANIPQHVLDDVANAPTDGPPF